MTTSTITDLLLFLGNENGHILVERGYVLKRTTYSVRTKAGKPATRRIGAELYGFACDKAMFDQLLRSKYVARDADRSRETYSITVDGRRASTRRDSTESLSE